MKSRHLPSFHTFLCLFKCHPQCTEFPGELFFSLNVLLPLSILTTSDISWLICISAVTRVLSHLRNGSKGTFPGSTCTLRQEMASGIMVKEQNDRKVSAHQCVWSQKMRICVSEKWAQSFLFSRTSDTNEAGSSLNCAIFHNLGGMTMNTMTKIDLVH